jgi:hypothetical protein
LSVNASDALLKLGVSEKPSQFLRGQRRMCERWKHEGYKIILIEVKREEEAVCGYSFLISLDIPSYCGNV